MLLLGVGDSKRPSCVPHTLSVNGRLYIVLSLFFSLFLFLSFQQRDRSAGTGMVSVDLDFLNWHWSIHISTPTTSHA